jgi:ATPase subunit of ABC transporter with duplicated ATPase domains
MKELEAQLDGIDIEKDPEAAERLCEQISRLEDQLEPADNEQVNIFHRMVEDDLRIDTEQPCMLLSVEQQKEVMLIAATVCSQYTTLLLLDEPTSFLSIPGLLRLRQLLETVTCTVVMITHDLDLINDVATDIIELRGLKLSYFPGNYDSYRLMKEQMETHQMKQALAVEKKRDQLRNTLQNIKEKPAPKRGGAKKKAKAVASHRKKMEWHEKDASEVSTSTCDVLLPDRKGLTATERIRLAQILRSVPDKAVQFV